MPDREKVIYDIERCICHVPDACRDCSHYGQGEVIGCMEELLTDALALLKEQEDKIRQLRLAEAIVLIPKSANKGTEIQMDVLPLVLCKDCEHCYFASNRIPSEQNYACGKHGFDVAPDWFCADGERRTDDA